MENTRVPRRRIDEKVSIDHPKYPGIWIVKTNTGTVNAVLQPEGGGRRLRVPHEMLIDPVEVAATTDGPPPTFYDPGEIVRLSDHRWTGLWVVIADRRENKVNVARLGGDNGRYLRALRSGLTRVDPTEVLK